MLLWDRWMDWVGRGVAKNTDKYITYGTAEKNNKKCANLYDDDGQSARIQI